MNKLIPEITKEEGDLFMKKVLARKKKELSKEEHKILKQVMFTNKYIVIEGKKFRCPRCHICWQPMKPAYDNIAKKITGYGWKCECLPDVTLAML